MRIGNVKIAVLLLSMALVLPGCGNDEYNNGYEHGYEDGYDGGYEDGYDDGYKECCEESFRADISDNKAVDNAVSSDETGIVAASDNEAASSNAIHYEYEDYGFVNVSDVIPSVILEIRYYSTYNFVGDRIEGYEAPKAILTKEAAAALKEASDELETMGYRIKIYDAYRPQMAVNHFVEWAEDTSDTRMKDYFYPEIDKSVLFSSGYISSHSRHSSGSTVDLTLFDMNTGKEVDMGGSFDYFGELSHPSYGGISSEQRANRELLRKVMERHGFSGISTEWWHFTLANEPYSGQYFDFLVE